MPEEKVFLVVEQYSKLGNTFELGGYACKEVSIGQKVQLKCDGDVSTFLIKEIEAYRKKIPTISQGYSCVLFVELISGPPVEFKRGRDLFSFKS